MQRKARSKAIAVTLRRDVDELMSAIHKGQFLKVFWELKVLLWGLLGIGAASGLVYAWFRTIG
jgi:hypothetical protein